MKPRNRWNLSAFAVIVAGVSLGCATTSSEIAKTDETKNTPTAVQQAPPAKATTATTAKTEPEPGPIYFDTDRALLRDEARATLKQHAEKLLASDGDGTITVEGHCDERGSDEYNMALGERRASVVSKYLKDLGVPNERLSHVSRGEMDPAVGGHDETAWKFNRRAEIVTDTDRLATR